MSVDGVVTADVSFDDAEAAVNFRPDRVSGDDLVRAVHEAGFEARVIEKTEHQ